MLKDAVKPTILLTVSNGEEKQLLEHLQDCKFVSHSIRTAHSTIFSFLYNKDLAVNTKFLKRKDMPVQTKRCIVEGEVNNVPTFLSPQDYLSLCFEAKDAEFLKQFDDLPKK